MKEKVLLLCTLVMSQLLFSQELIGLFRNDLKNNSTDINDVLPVINYKNNDIIMFIADAKKVYGYKLNDDFEVINKLSSETKKRKYKTFLGNSFSKNNHSIFLTNDEQNKFLYINFDFHNNSTQSKEFFFETQEEILIQTVSINSKFFIITTQIYTNNLFIYEINNGEPKRHKIDLTEIEILTDRGNLAFISKLFLDSGIRVNKIDENSSNNIVKVADPVKIYSKNESVIFTFDNNPEILQVLTVSLKDFSAKVDVFEKGLKNNITVDEKKSNSYLFGDYVFLVTSTKEKLHLDILDYKTKENIKKYEIQKEKPISFKNTPIIQVGGDYANYRELNKTEKFLKKINLGNIGVSVRKSNENYHLILGGYQIIHRSSPHMNTNGSFAPTLHFTKIKSTRIELLLDKDFNHVKGEIPKNAFDKILNSKNTGTVKKAETTFKYKNFFINGIYYAKPKQYKFLKYTDD